VLAAGSNFVQARAELSNFFPFTLYGEWTWPGEVADYFATGGFYVAINTPGLPQVAAPSVTGQIGVGTVLVGPQPRRATFYAMLRIRP
jgi:hypothetical protein